MKIDPSDQINTMKARPSLNGSGSGKANWIAYADRLEEANVSLGDLINEQAEVIKDRDAEIARLQKQIATRKPKGQAANITSDNRQDRAFIAARLNSALPQRTSG